MNNIRLLVADDKESILKLFQDAFAHGFDITTAADGQKALAMALNGNFDVVVSDIRMPGLDGLTLLREIKHARPEVEVILMTAFASIPNAVEAMKEGAYDYLTKPFDPEEALLVVQRAAERKRLREQAENLQSLLQETYGFRNLVGKSPTMRKVFELMRRAANAEATVLIMGESGTGKELVARAIHCEGLRKDRRFVAVNCGAIPENLIESELFGHKKGSFTGAIADKRGLFEEAEGGTLFLDEVGELPLPLQVKLTRVLQERAVRRIGEAEERPVDVRILAATNVDLKEAVKEGKFREDLFYRLNIFPIRLPPLRERREDIPLLAALFLERHGRQQKSPVTGFTPEALSALMRYDWPGNVRELQNAIERALAVSDGPRIGMGALPEEMPEAGGTPRISSAAGSLTYHEAVQLAVDRTSRDYLGALMREFKGNVTKAAERAGIERESLHRLLKRYGMRSEMFKEKDSAPQK
ncbi:sigma-54 dependent transcriptional regulator [Methylocaldum sp. 14B]|uniref:sigma-54-dependent transcriptional regulator n=1 Tax=Methylocaldum sp. 14B TaxID=1912213 RepID=UPI00098ACA7C|nr:sigma-54 dependent transcriptional regulator [Methylocaldum sp. 14B]